MIHLRTLGGIDLRRSSGEEVRAVLAQPKRLALLAYLAIARPRGAQRKDILRALFWPDADDRHARLDLNRAAHFLRHALSDEPVVSGPGDTLGVDPAALWCDAVAFEEALDGGRLEDALALYRGELLAGLHVSDAPEFEHWLDQERDHLRLRGLEAALTLAEREERGGHAVAAARWASRALDVSPYDERAARRLVRLLDAAGDRPEAIRRYEDFARRLGADLSLEPAPETQALVDAVRTRLDPQKVTPITVPARGPVSRSQPPRIHRTRRRLTLAGFVLAAGVAGWGIWRVQAVSAPGIPVQRVVQRVAVLPFTSIGAAENEFLHVGITEEVIARLTKVPGLVVMVPTSLSPEMVEGLGVRAVLQGSVTRSSGRVRIVARLRDARTHEALWAETFERDLHDLLDVQAEIPRQIAAALAVGVGDETTARLARRSPRNSDAYVAYLKGRYFLGKRTPEALHTAIAYFEQAVAQDSAYALAYAGLADAHGVLSFRGGTIRTAPPLQTLAAAKEFALQAVALDSTLAEARLSLALFRHSQEWDWAGAQREYQRAIRLDPQNATARQWYALLLRDLGRLDHALLELRHALQLDPLSPTANRSLGVVLLSRGRVDEAIEQLRKTQELEPTLPLVREWLRNAYAAAGRYEEAFQEQLAVAARQGWPPDAIDALGAAYEAKGWDGVQELILAHIVQVSRGQYVSPAVLAGRHAQLGRIDDAFALLDQAYSDRDPALTSIKTNPLYGELRGDRRFAALVRRMQLPR